MSRLIALALAFCPVVAQAAAPAFLPVQARLVDAGGTPIEDATTVTFSLYTLQSGGPALYSEVRAIDPENGYFAVFLGEVTPLDWTLVQGTSQMYIGMDVGGAGEMTRQPIGTVPFAAFADYAANSGTVEDLDVDGIVAEVVSTYPAIVDPYTDADAVAAMGALSDSNDLNHDRYTDSDALAAAGPLGDSNPHHHDRYTDTDALSAGGSQGNTNPRNHTRYADSEALSAAGGLANSNPRHHTRYADSEAQATVAAQDIYMRNTGDVMSGSLEITGSLTTNESPLVMYPTMMSFFRAGDGAIHYTAPDGSTYILTVGDGTASAGLGASSKVAYAPGNGTTTWGKLYFNLNGIPSYACTLLHNEDDSIRHGFGFATDGGNGYASIWGGSTNTKTFVLEREGTAGVPIGVNQSFRIICF
jgi:hypothetical protein